MTATEYQSLVVLPAIRLRNLHEAVDAITGDREMARAVMAAVERHIEVDAYRWGNACPRSDCHAPLEWRETAGHVCPVHGYLGHLASTELLIAFKPSRSTS